MVVSANFMWQAQGALHKNKWIVPGGLLAISVSLVVYCHVTSDHSSELADPLKTFLCLILLQILPLAALELKIMSCADPVGVFCKFAVPVTLLHAIFLAMRFLHWWSYGQSYLVLSVISLFGAIFTMLKGFHWTPSALFHHKAVWGLCIFSVGAAFFSHWLENYMTLKIDPISWLEWSLRADQDFFDATQIHPIADIFATSNSYMEIVAFVPAVWLVFFEDKTKGRAQVEELDTKRTSTAFFLFLVCFYLSEDVLNAIEAWKTSRLATAAHFVHFLLLLDFACYILAHIYNPQKLVGELRKWLPVDLAYDV